MLGSLEDILDAIVLIKGSKNDAFGSGFAIKCDHEGSWIITCAHVVKAVSVAEDSCKAKDIKVNGKPAEVLACGTFETVDLALLEVKGLFLPTLTISPVGQFGLPCNIVGGTELNDKEHLKRVEPLDGSLGRAIYLTTGDGKSTKAWRLEIESKTKLEEGYSGSPVICASTLHVMGVASIAEYEGDRGFAVSITHLKDIYPKLPSDLLCAQLSPSVLSWEKHTVLEDIFRIPPISEEELRTLCQQVLPKSEPHGIPVGAGFLDLLDWLFDRGRLPDGRVPLLAVLQELAPKLKDQETRDKLDHYIELVATHFGINDLSALTLPQLEETPDSPALMLEIWPTSSQGNQYNLHGKVYFSTERVFIACVREDETALNVEDDSDVTDLMVEIKEKLESFGVNENNVVIEFILPLGQLSWPVEQWKNDLDEPIGIISTVVVRSRERYRNQSFITRWQHGWKTLCRSYDNALEQRLSFLAEDDWRQVRSQLQAGNGIALRFVPDLDAPIRPSEKNIVNYMLNVGVPVALWPRDREGLDGFIAQLNNAPISQLPLKELPSITRDVRRQLWEQKEENSPGYHLTLLWDDPTRCLADKPKHDDEFYQAPGQA
ncbi:MAG: trypsin-like peptidase domain-containing protein [Caldilineaceae bacterium]|nr:trypsin-like peptidase domain-containing protein [Caldilineaceae bacterium]